MKTMKNCRVYFLSLLTLLAVTMTSCDLVGDIFEAGMWTAIIVIVLVIFFIIWIFRKLMG